MKQVGAFSIDQRGEVVFHEGETDMRALRTTLDKNVTGGPHRAIPAYMAEVGTEGVSLDLEESGTLCHLLMQKFNESGGPDKQPPWALALYTKLANANDKLMGK